VNPQTRMSALPDKRRPATPFDFFNSHSKFSIRSLNWLVIIEMHESTIQRPKAVVLTRLVRLLLLSCGALYLLICAGMAIAQRSLVYFPSVFTREQVDQMAQSARLERWTNSAGQFIGLTRPYPATGGRNGDDHVW